MTVLAAASLVFAACGSDDELSVDTSDFTLAPAGEGGAQFGASLEEWAEASAGEDEAGSDAAVVNDYPDGYEELAWEDLLPPGDSSADVYARYEDQLAGLEDGSPEADAIYAQMQAEYDATSGDVNSELSGAKVNLAGFVAALDFEDDIVTEFLLVPYFGACIHVPAPPPNQTVLVKVDKADGLTLGESWGAVWVAGTLTVDPATTDLATASYTMTGATTGVYDEYG